MDNEEKLPISTPASETPSESAPAKQEKVKEKKLKLRGKNMVQNTEELSNKYNYVIQNKKVARDAKAKKSVFWILIALLALVILGGGIWGMTTYIEYNNFKVLIDRDGQNVFQLSPSPTFQIPSEVINISGPRYMDNTTLMGMEDKIREIEMHEGSFEQDNMICATFYFKNITEEEHLYSENIEIVESTKNIESAIRILLIKTKSDGTRECNIYAMAKEDGTPERAVPERRIANDPTSDLLDYPRAGYVDIRNGSYEKLNENVEPWMAIPFLDEDTVLNNSNNTIKGGEIIKYTIVIWLEGHDDDCVDDKLGGEIKLDFNFTHGA